MQTWVRHWFRLQNHNRNSAVQIFAFDVWWDKSHQRIVKHIKKGTMHLSNNIFELINLSKSVIKKQRTCFGPWIGFQILIDRIVPFHCKLQSKRMPIYLQQWMHPKRHITKTTQIAFRFESPPWIYRSYRPPTPGPRNLNENPTPEEFSGKRLNKSTYWLSFK